MSDEKHNEKKPCLRCHIKRHYKTGIRWLITVALLYAVFIEAGPWTSVAFLGVAVWMEMIQRLVNLFVGGVDAAGYDIEGLEGCMGEVLERLDIQDGREEWISAAMQKGRADGH